MIIILLNVPRLCFTTRVTHEGQIDTKIDLKYIEIIFQ